MEVIIDINDDPIEMALAERMFAPVTWKRLQEHLKNEQEHGKKSIMYQLINNPKREFPLKRNLNGIQEWKTYMKHRRHREYLYTLFDIGSHPNEWKHKVYETATLSDTPLAICTDKYTTMRIAAGKENNILTTTDNLMRIKHQRFIYNLSANDSELMHKINKTEGYEKKIRMLHSLEAYSELYGMGQMLRSMINQYEALSTYLPNGGYVKITKWIE